MCRWTEVHYWLELGEPSHDKREEATSDSRGPKMTEITVIQTNGAKAVIVKMSHTDMGPCRSAKYAFPPSLSLLRDERKTGHTLQTFVEWKRKTGNKGVDHLLEKRAKCNKKEVLNGFTADFPAVSKKNSNVLFEIKAFLIFPKSYSPCTLPGCKCKYWF